MIKNVINGKKKFPFFCFVSQHGCMCDYYEFLNWNEIKINGNSKKCKMENFSLFSSSISSQQKKMLSVNIQQVIIVVVVAVVYSNRQ